jgi:probable rRNA maturation factor
MSRTVHVATEGVRIAVARERVASLAKGVLRAERVRDATVSVAFVTDRRIAALNRQHLGHTGPTDVISFAFEPVGSEAEVVGDVYIAPDVARKNARAHGRGVREELLRLVVHGILHVVGHNHPEDDSRYRSPMWKRQEQLLRALGGGAA